MHDYQKEFIEFLVRSEALRFGEFTLKSGRKSPYFFNAGQFNLASAVERLGYYYACAIRELEPAPTVVFGPAYKGIPLAISAAIALKQHFGVDAYTCFDRKEAKDHGEGGWLVGKTPQAGDRVVIVDDVITDGATKVDVIQRLRQACQAEIRGLVIALDRRERTGEGRNAVADLEATTGVRIRSIVTIHDVLGHLPGRTVDGRMAMPEEAAAKVREYLARFGIAG